MELQMTVASNFRPNESTQRRLDHTPSSHDEFELLPWADPYIAMLVNRYVAETKPAKPRTISRPTNVVAREHLCESMLDRFAI
jgi:hypothetical protein